MNTVVKLSVCIIACNEADRIARTLSAVRPIADEIIVVDNGSDDDTVAIARALGARVFHHDWSGYGPQKRFAEDQAKNHWILNLDADEVVSPELCREIRGLLRGLPPLNAYRIRIRTVYPGAARPRLWADFNNYVRLYDKTRVRFRDSPVHDTVDTLAEQVGQLRGPVIHFAARSFAHIRAKLDAYTTLQAQTLRKSRAAIAARLPLEYPLVFLKFYLLRCHFTGGWPGILSSHLAAEWRVRRLLKMWKAAG